jgi:outer membrane lipoprotein carrier protein
MMRYVMLATAMAAVATVARAQSSDATIDKAVAAYKSMKTARATFEQTITNPLTGSAANSRGEFEQLPPGRFIFRFASGDKIVGDGKTIWVYLPSTNPGQVIRMPANSGVGSLDIIGQFFTSPKTRYTISEAGTANVSGSATHALKLDPKDGTDAMFARATVWVDDDDGTLRQFETVDRAGVKRFVKITKLEPNVSVDPKAFEFKPPKGVRVVDQEALSRR